MEAPPSSSNSGDNLPPSGTQMTSEVPQVNRNEEGTSPQKNFQALLQRFKHETQRILSLGEKLPMDENTKEIEQVFWRVSRRKYPKPHEMIERVNRPIRDPARKRKMMKEEKVLLEWLVQAFAVVLNKHPTHFVTDFKKLP